MDSVWKDVAQTLLGLSLIVFMAGNLFDTGLKLRLEETANALVSWRFAASSIVWAFVVGPLAAVALTKIFSLSPPYEMALIFLGLAPCAPFLPMMAERARCRLGDVAAFMLLASVGTIVFVPLLAPFLAKGFAADAWTIAKPLLLYVALPMAAGVLVRRLLGQRADMLLAPVRIATLCATALMMVLLVFIYGRDFMSMPGTWSIAALVIFCTLLPAASYALAFGLDHSQRSVLVLGLCTRNIGAAIAPLFAMPDSDPQAIAMCAFAVPVTVIASAVGARLLARRGRRKPKAP
jgi:BASS family bile acid:Na+ symporter